MDFISWLVFGVLCLLAEFAIGNFYLLVIGLAFVYPSLATLMGASTSAQLLALALGSTVHVLLLSKFRRPAPSASDAAPQPVNEGDSVEVLEWLDESSARVRYRSEEWLADKADDRMPNSSSGTILKAQYGRLVIATEPEKTDGDAPR